jgi:hypothetical protein
MGTLLPDTPYKFHGESRFLIKISLFLSKNETHSVITLQHFYFFTLSPMPASKSKSSGRGSKASYSAKQKRKAEHIEEGYKKRGASTKKAERIAWATVNKQDGGARKK